MPAQSEPVPVVIDTNVALDLLVFNDPAHALQMAPLREALGQGRLQWLATPAMRDELQRVLAYPKLAPRVSHYGCTPESVVQAWEQQVTLCEVAPRAAFVCSDADDQMFIDLAVAHSASLLSKDSAVLTLKKRLAGAGVQVCDALTFISDALN